MNENIQSLLEKYQKIRDQKNADAFIDFLISWDSQTEAPSGCFDQRAKQMQVIGERSYSYNTSPEVTEVIEKLYACKSELDEVTAHEITEAKKNIDQMKKIPMDLYVQMTGIFAKSEYIWANAKTNNDFEMFKPVLNEIVDCTRKYVDCLKTDKLVGYNVLLDQYETGMTIEKYDKFFDLLKEKLVPFIKKVTETKLVFNDSFLKEKYPKETQKLAMEYIQDIMCFDRNHGIIKESEHPFTSGFGTDDVRFTVHYYEDLPLSAIFSAIHELGHATYESQVNPKLNSTLSCGGASMAMHESQSRFYENIIGRSYEFWETHFPKIKEIYAEQMKDTTLDDFVKAINTVEKSLIRTEADELTYPIHIMIRYDIEKALFDGNLEVEDLPKVWNQKVKEYLGIDVPNDTLGVLQDVHWAGGSFGYFPTYALGSAYAAQIFSAMKKDLDIKKALSKETTKDINEWLKSHIHTYGATKYPLDILKLATNEDFNPQYYIDYLIEKYTKIYNI